MESFEVGIIGGGVHGASAAFHLGVRGASAVLFERGAAASGPTGRSSAVCRAYYTNPFLARVARASLDMLASFGEHTGGRDAGFRATGALFLHGSEDRPEVEKATARLNALGTTTELLELEELGGRVPDFDLNGVGIGAWEHGAGYADPAATTTALLECARELGVDVRLYTPVSTIEHDPAGSALTITAAGGRQTKVERLLIAAGPWTRALAAQVGVELPLTVERHIVSTFAWGRADPIPFVLADVINGYYFKPEGRDQYFVGPLHATPPIADPDSYDPEISDSEVAGLAELVTSRAPALADTQPRGGWASLYDVSPDWQPVIGEVAEGVFVDAGTSGHGFKLAPALGGYVADLVLGDPDPALMQFSPQRFDDGSELTGGYGQAKILG